MSSIRIRMAALSTVALGASALAAGSASAATPSYDRCPTADPNVVECVFLQSTSGVLGANSNSINLGDHVTFEGGAAQDPITSDVSFVPPASGDALTSTPITIASASIGLPASYTTITATIQQVGPANFNDNSFDLTVPVRVKFNNPLLGSNCAVGSTAEPISLHLTTGTTHPPAPNTPVSGSHGAISRPATPAGTFFESSNVVEVDNAYAVPAATNCGAVAQSTVTKAINSALGLPSPAGTNSASLTGNLFVGYPVL
jgi:hypothetical protein